MTETASHRINALFALSAQSPEKLGVCGSTAAADSLVAYLLGNYPKDIVPVLSQYKDMQAMERVIAALSESDNVFDHRIARNYWLGGPLLEQISRMDNQLVLENIITQLRDAGYAEPFLSAINNKLLSVKILPFHNSFVTQINVEDIGGLNRSNLPAVNKCLVRCGTVTEINSDHTLGLAGTELKLGENHRSKYRMTDTDYRVMFDPDLIYPRVGDCVATHHGKAVMKLDPQQKSDLIYWTNYVVEEIKPAKPGSPFPYR